MYSGVLFACVCSAGGETVLRTGGANLVEKDVFVTIAPRRYKRFFALLANTQQAKGAGFCGRGLYARQPACVECHGAGQVTEGREWQC